MTALAARPALSPDTTLAVTDLCARYNLAVDLGDVDAWVGCFTADGSFRITGHTAWAHAADVPEVDLHGAAELRAFMGQVTDERRVRHWTTNLVLRARADEGLDALSLMTVWDLAADRAGEVVLTGVMRDRLVPTASGWSFLARHLTLDK